MQQNIRKQPQKRRLGHESLESRRLLAFAAFKFNLFSDNGGVPGSLVTQDQVQVGDRFFVEVTAQEFDPQSTGLTGISLDLNWDPAVLEVVQEDFNLNRIITDQMPLLRDGELHNDQGTIANLRAMALTTLGAGQNLGNGSPERFAMIPFRALSASEGSLLRMRQGGSNIAIDTTGMLWQEHLDFERQVIQVMPASQATPEIQTSITPQSSPDATLIAEESAQSVESNSNALQPNGFRHDVQLNVKLKDKLAAIGRIGELINIAIKAVDARLSSLGISGLGVNVAWDPSVLELVLPTSGNIVDVVNSKLALFREGSVDQAAGKISDLGGASLPAAGIGGAIGIGQAESLAELQFRVLQAADSTSITVSPTDSGAGLVGSDTASVSSTSLTLETIPDTGSAAIDVTLSGDKQDQLSFATRDATGKMLSDLVRPANPDTSQAITIRNTGTGALTVDRIDTGSPHVIVEDAEGFTVAPGSSRTLQVTYAPQGRQPTTWRPEILDITRGIIVISNAVNLPEVAVGVSARSTFDADLNLDGRVDLADVSRFNNHFGKRAGEPEYSKVNDPNGDGKVDLGDMGVLNAQYGKRREYTVDQAPGASANPTAASNQTTVPRIAPVAPVIPSQRNTTEEMDALLEELARGQLGL